MSEDQNWENGSFEELIRRSVEDPQLEFDPKAWEAMEEKLDAQAGGTRSGGTGHAGRAGKIGAGLVALLLMSLIGWYLLSDTEENVNTGAERQERVQLSDPVSGDRNNPVELQSQDVHTESAAEGSELEALSETAGEEDRKAAVSAGKGHLASSGGSVSMAGRSASSLGPGNADSHQAGADRTGNKLIANTGNIDNISNESAGALADEEAKEQVLQKRPWHDFVFGQVEIIPLSQAEQGETATGKEQEEEVVPARPDHLPLSLSLSVAPDFSGTGESASTRLGAGAGIHLEYRILPRLGLVTGLVYSQKNYLADGRQSPYDMGYYYPKPDYIDASCGVLDIPLNLRYYVFQGKRHSFFFSSGLSSYLMRSEDYTLVYYDERYDDYTYELRNENRHYFAVYNFSAGYEVRLAPRWALQAEPFLKIPAKGVGAGEIRLNSMGAFVHLKYRIGRPVN